MSIPRNKQISWHKLETANLREADQLKPEILDMFWRERIESYNKHSIDLIKGFLYGRPPSTWNGTTIDRDTWQRIVDMQFNQAIRDKDPFIFLKLFEHVPGIDILVIDKGERFGISPQNIERREVVHKVTKNDETMIRDYMDDRKISATVSIISQAHQATLSTEENAASSVFSIHSVGKIFTGIMILDLIDRGILPEDALKQPIKISKSTVSKLPSSIVERLERVTLLDVMHHKGGFGDFVGNYVAAIKSSLDKHDKLPEIINIEDFLKYANDELSESGKVRYSNLGSLLVGLAAEHAYAEYQQKHLSLPQLDFNGMLHQFVKEPSGMKYLTDKAPDDAKVNDSKTIDEPTPEARHLIGSPCGGYWTSVDDLAKFGEWLYRRSNEENFGRLVRQYGKEFQLDDNTLGHKGENPSASAMLSISLKTGTVIAVLSNSGRHDAHILEEAIRTNIFSRPCISNNDLTSSAQIAKALKVEGQTLTHEEKVDASLASAEVTKSNQEGSGLDHSVKVIREQPQAQSDAIPRHQTPFDTKLIKK